ncbi:Xaa-Pro dipeptidyl-peptidase, partial [Streptomyces decoyicus]
MTNPARIPRIPFTVLVMAVVAALLSVLIGPAAAQAAPGESRPVYSYDHAIRESVWVDTRLDGDADG